MPKPLQVSPLLDPARSLPKALDPASQLEAAAWTEPEDAVTEAASWLQGALQAERESLGVEIEKRHKQLLVRFAIEVQQVKSIGKSGVGQVDKAPTGVEEKLAPEGPEAPEDESKLNEHGKLAVGGVWQSVGGGSRNGPEQSVVEVVEDGDTEDGVEDGATPAPFSWEENAHSQPSQRQVSVRPSMLTSYSTVFFSERAHQGIMGRLHDMCLSHRFELCFALLIAANTVVLMFEAQYKGFNLGYSLGHASTAHPAEDVWPMAHAVWPILDMFFGVLFTAEILIKILGLKQKFFRCKWNIFDLVVVLVWNITTADLGDVPIPPTLLRMARMARLLRLLRLVRTIQEFDSLYLLTASIKGSVAAAFWSILFLCVVEASMAISLNFLLEAFMTDPAKSISARREVYEYFGTFSRALLTMLEMALGNWIPPTRVVAEHVGEWYVVIFLAHKFIVGFAVVKVITGVFMHETFKCAAMDDALMVRQQTAAVEMHTKKIKKLFRCGDTSQDNFLDLDEFQTVVHDPDIHQWLGAMGLHVDDAGAIFQLVQRQQGSIKLSVDQLVDSTAKLKGPARAVDLALIAHNITVLEEKLDAASRSLPGKGSKLSPAQTIRHSPTSPSLG